MKTFDDIQINDPIYYVIINKDYNISSIEKCYVTNKIDQSFYGSWKLETDHDIIFCPYKGKPDGESYPGMNMLIYGIDENHLKNAIYQEMNERIIDYEHRITNIQNEIKELKNKEKTYKKLINKLESNLS